MTTTIPNASPTDTTARPIPSGAMVEISVDLIDEGKFRRAVDRAIHDAHRALQEFREIEGEGTCKAVIDVRLELSYDKDIANFVQITHNVIVKPPRPPVRATFVKEVAGRLLAQPSGSTADSPDQLRLFSPTGSPIGVGDLRTMTMVPEADPIAGTIGSAS